MTPPPADQAFQEEALRFLGLMQEAGDLLQSIGADKKATNKSDGELVTETDREIELMLVDRLREWYPEDRICGEEFGEKGAVDSLRSWYVDPIDGTRSFVDGRPGFSIMIAATHHGEPSLGLVFDPMDKTLYAATLDSGLSIDGQGVVRPLAGAGKSQPNIIWNPYSDNPLKSRFQESLGLRGVLEVESTGLRALHLLLGRGRLFTSSGLSAKYWDVCAAWVIVKLAGARYTDFRGKELRFDGPDPTHTLGALATRDLPHHQACSILREYCGI